VRPGLPHQLAHRRGGWAHSPPTRRTRSRSWRSCACTAARWAASTPGTPKAWPSRRKKVWDDAYEAGQRHGYRNAQVTVIAPTGTIGFMMDCDTTGIEPDLALVKYKKLVGGGAIKIVNNTVPQALIRLGYTPAHVEQIVSHIDATGTIEGAPGSNPSICRSSIAASTPKMERVPSTTWATSA